MNHSSIGGIKNQEIKKNEKTKKNTDKKLGKSKIRDIKKNLKENKKNTDKKKNLKLNVLVCAHEVLNMSQNVMLTF